MSESVNENVGAVTRIALAYLDWERTISLEEAITVLAWKKFEYFYTHADVQHAEPQKNLDNAGQDIVGLEKTGADKMGVGPIFSKTGEMRT